MQTNGVSTQNSFRRGVEFGCNTPSSYRIRVIGELDESSLEHLRGLEISTSGQEKKPVTTISGQLPDQAALFAVLEALYDLRLPLLSVRCLENT